MTSTHAQDDRATPATVYAPPTVSVVVPTLNEERNLPHVFARIPADVAEVILVDGGSTDRTVAVARELMPTVRIVQQTRTGKGNALACGFAACTSEIIVMIDADGSTDPAEIPDFVAVLVGTETTPGRDYAKGSRFCQGGGSDDITRFRKFGNHGLNAVVNTLFRTNYSDLCYGYNAFWRRLLPYLDLPDTGLPRTGDGSKLWGDGFEIEALINIRVAAAGFTIGEVPSIEAERLHGRSNLNAFSDGTRVLRTILREFRRHRRLIKGRGTIATGAAGTAAPVPITLPAAHRVDLRHLDHLSVPKSRDHGIGIVARHPVNGTRQPQRANGSRPEPKRPVTIDTARLDAGDLDPVDGPTAPLPSGSHPTVA